MSPSISDDQPRDARPPKAYYPCHPPVHQVARSSSQASTLFSASPQDASIYFCTWEGQRVFAGRLSSKMCARILYKILLQSDAYA